MARRMIAVKRDLLDMVDDEIWQGHLPSRQQGQGRRRAVRNNVYMLNASCNSVKFVAHYLRKSICVNMYLNFFAPFYACSLLQDSSNNLSRLSHLSNGRQNSLHDPYALLTAMHLHRGKRLRRTSSSKSHMHESSSNNSPRQHNQSLQSL